MRVSERKRSWVARRVNQIRVRRMVFAGVLDNILMRVPPRIPVRVLEGTRSPSISSQKFP